MATPSSRTESTHTPISSLRSGERKEETKEAKRLTKLWNHVVDGLKKKVGRHLGRNILKINPADLKKLEDHKAIKQEKITQGNAESVSIPGNGHSTLDGLILRPKVESDKWIVVFNGINVYYEEHIIPLEHLADDVGANVITFNYRGVIDSEGRPSSAADLIEDGECVMQFLIDEKGLISKNTSIYGHSMGGGIAAKVQENHPECSFVTESTFKTFASAVAAKKGKTLAFIFEKAGWNFNTLDAVANREGKTLTIVHRHDPTIPYEKASLYKAHKERIRDGLEEGERKDIQRIKVGSKNRKVGAGVLDMRIDGNKVVTKDKAPKEKDRTNEEDYKSLKDQKLVKYLYHPHHRIMDRLFVDTPPKLPKKISDENREIIQRVNVQFRQEDEIAYGKMVDLFKEFLEIPRPEPEDQPEE